MASSDSFVPRTERVTLPARLAALTPMAAFAQAFCDRHGIERPRALRLKLVLEELFTNTIHHGYCAESDAPVVIVLTLIDGPDIELLYEDAAPHYDLQLRLSTSPASLGDAIEQRPVGGLGVHLVGAMVDVLGYEYSGGWNRLRVKMRRRDA
jgi:anti-sigma regulatory factor (Ser/Thr protein kinase)